LKVETQVAIKAYFEGEMVGEYFADVLVADCVILELKAGEAICEAHEAQLLNYLKATDIEVGLLLNFGPKAQFHRKVFTNARNYRPQT
jgi:GxxExxY protein